MLAKQERLRKFNRVGARGVSSRRINTGGRGDDSAGGGDADDAAGGSDADNSAGGGDADNAAGGGDEDDSDSDEAPGPNVDEAAAPTAGQAPAPTVRRGQAPGPAAEGAGDRFAEVPDSQDGSVDLGPTPARGFEF